MFTFIKIALRNIIRNKFRSVITCAAISLGLAALIFLMTFVEGADRQMLENYTDLISGHIQIHHQGFQKKMGLDRSIKDIAGINQVLNNNPSVEAYSRRVKDFALISSSEQSSGVLLMGVDHGNEGKITKLPEKIIEGHFLTGNSPDEIVIGKDLKELLNVNLKEKIVVMAQAADGSLAADAYRVCGILDTGTEEIDKSVVLIDIEQAQELLVLGDRVQEIVVRVDDVFSADKISSEIKAAIQTDDLEVLTWGEIAPMIVQWLEFDRTFTNIILFVVLLVVSAGILNTILMGVLERIREFGIMMAIGTKRRQVVLMVVLESFFLGSIGVIAGTGFGLSLALYFSHYGVDLSSFSNAFESYYVGSFVYPKIIFKDIFNCSWLVLFTSVIISVYPAIKASRLKPVEAIHNF